MSKSLCEEAHLVTIVNLEIFFENGVYIYRSKEKFGLLNLALVLVDLALVLLDLIFNFSDVLGGETSAHELNK